MSLNCCPTRSYRFPDESTPTALFDGQVFAELPIVHIKCSKNNTLFTATDALGTFNISHVNAMGDKVAPRRAFIEEHGAEYSLEALDI